ncbi:MAG: pitrilysin family protein [Polyangia bacterium]
MIPSSQLAFGRLVAKKHQLDNGLSVILLRDASAPVLAYQTWFRVGSRNEVKGRTGIAHLFEHLMFNQTMNLPPGEFDRRIESVGGETNAGTWVDWTYYVTNAPSGALHTLVELEAERMQHLLLGDEQVESEREVVMNERRFRVDDSVDGMLNEALYQRAFTRHPYQWPTIGWMPDIEAITIEDCRAFYRTYYAPNNATLVIVGDLDEDATLAAVQAAYGPIARQVLPTEQLPTEPPQLAQRRWEVHKAVPADRVQLGWPAVGEGDVDHATLDVVAELMGGGNASRLYRALVVERELASSVQASVAPFRDPGLFEISIALTRGHRSEEAEVFVDALLQTLAKDGPRPGEVDGARARLLTRFWTGLRPQSGKAEGLGHAEVTLGDYRRLFEAPQRYAAVDAEAVQRAVAKYLQPERCTTVVARPLEKP